MKLAQAVLATLALSLTLSAQDALQQTFTPNTNVDVALVGTTSIPVAPAGAAASQPQVRRLPELKKPVFAGLAAPLVNSSSLVVPGLPIFGSSVFGFDALDSRDSAIASGFIVEPPDEAIGVSTTQILDGERCDCSALAEGNDHRRTDRW